MDLTFKEFELLLCEFCKQDLPPHFTVEHDIKEIGGESGGKRQIDIRIKGRLGISEILICGEAKYWGVPIGSDTIDALVGKYFSGEVRATKVILFSNHGYTKPAIERSKLLGIELLEPTDIGNPIKITPYIVGIGYMRQMVMQITHKTPQYTQMSVDLEDYTIIKGEERISLQQNIFRILKMRLILMGHKDFKTDLSAFLVKDSNVLYELNNSNGGHYTADFEVNVSLFWDYFIENFPAGMLRHVNKNKIIFVNLQGNPFKVLKKVLLSPTKINYENKDELLQNVILKNTGHVALWCMPDPDKQKIDPGNPVFSFI